MEEFIKEFKELLDKHGVQMKLAFGETETYFENEKTFAYTQDVLKKFRELNENIDNFSA